MALFLSIFWLISQLLYYSLACYDKRDHVTPITRENRKLKGNHLIQRLSTTSQISCSHLCLKNSRCLSINYNLSGVEDGGLCELNDAGLSDDFEEKDLVMAKGFIFSQIRCKKVSFTIHIFHSRKVQAYKSHYMYKNSCATLGSTLGRYSR